MKEELSVELQSSNFKIDVLALQCPGFFWSTSPPTSFSVNNAQSEIFCALFGILVDNFQQKEERIFFECVK